MINMILKIFKQLTNQVTNLILKMSIQ